MDAMISFSQLAVVLKAYGPIGMIIVIWYIDIRQIRKMAEQYRSDVDRVLAEHKAYMGEIRRMYENNVVLVEGYADLSKDLKDIIIMNTTELSHLRADIEQNQYCPAQQINKKRIQVAE